MTIRLLFILRRRWPILVLIPLFGAAVGYVFTPRGEAVRSVAYSSKAIIAVDQGATSPTKVQQDVLEVEQGAIASQIAEEQDMTRLQVGRRVNGAFDPERFVLTLEVKGSDRRDAEKFARIVATSFVKAANARPADDRARQIIRATNARDAASEELQTFLDQNAPVLELPQDKIPPSITLEQENLRRALEQAEANLDQVEATSEETEIYRTVNVQPGGIATQSKLQLPASLALRVTLGFIFGLVGAMVLIALVEKLNPRIDDPDQATALIGAPVLAMVPVMNRRRRSSIERPDPAEFRGPFAEAFRSMRSHLDFRAATDPSDTVPRIMVTSATPAEGKSTTAAYLALSYAEVDRRPVVIGADLRRPSIHKFFQVDRVPGLSSRAATGGSSVPLSEIVQHDAKTGVSVVASGPSVDRVTGLLGDLTAVTLAAQAADRVAIVDTAPVMVANDVVDFLVAVDWVLVVVRVGRSTERSVRQMMKTLNLNEANVVGVVMVGSMESSDAKRYYYSYYSDTHDRSGPNRKPTAIPPSEDQPVPVSGSIDG